MSLAKGHCVASLQGTECPLKILKNIYINVVGIGSIDQCITSYCLTIGSVKLIIYLDILLMEIEGPYIIQLLAAKLYIPELFQYHVL